MILALFFNFSYCVYQYFVPISDLACMFEITIAEGFKNYFASIWRHNKRFRLTIPLPCFGIFAHGPDTRYRRGAGEWVCANEFIGNLCRPSLVKPEVP